MNLAVYLSGGITGLTFEEASKWRLETASRLRAAGFRVLDPLRGKSWLSHQEKPIGTQQYPKRNPTLSDKALKDRDKLDVLNSDIVLVNLLDAKRVSIGTMFEVAWAEDHNKLVVAMLSKDDTVHDHAFIRESAVVFHSLDEAVRYVISCNTEWIEKD